MIGVFDSGYGGLTIFRDIEKKLPQYSYIYLGDNARAPYGDLSQKLIYQYSQKAVDYLMAEGCQLIIFACNTASAMALRKLQQEYLPAKYPGKNVLGVIRPLVESVVELAQRSRVGVMATASTVKSEAYVNEFSHLDCSIEVFQESCPLLVPLIEASRENSPETNIILTEYIRPLKRVGLDTVVLGCTHYGFLQEAIEKSFGVNVRVLRSGQIIADKLADYLKRHPEYNHPVQNPTQTFLTTGDNKKFDQAAQKFLGRAINSLTIKLK
ncbi:MAG: glutamate racemase [Candidatus Komeilibacteria bacterium RIFOXYC1_FULL_37_11]|uniref:Glutamate racemase n=1 Tax=Candidatus Komeilibacteria bacterium RIFOXYC1_FULL_37_11 TaxID=1798555 RepID=A0A1G2C072_9BACT|nr:MAG: glutamate racemase [Candidatus Komeilibacteria bacterium RIFOXYC1_FULL_37_11]OGY95202.1 MAG: glutamate racemase [Candidatus Komeilibacteria bacterium RIFOXYD1_FULL_37_29]